MVLVARAIDSSSFKFRIGLFASTPSKSTVQYSTVQYSTVLLKIASIPSALCCIFLDHRSCSQIGLARLANPHVVGEGRIVLPLVVPADHLAPIQAMDVHNVSSRESRSQEVGGISVDCCCCCCSAVVVVQLPEEHPIRLVEVFAGVLDGVGNVRKMLPHGFVLAMDPESLGVQFRRQDRHGLFVQSPFFCADGWDQIVVVAVVVVVGGGVVATTTTTTTTTTTSVFVAEVVDNRTGFVETKSVFLDQDRYLPERVVLFGDFGLGHDGDVSIGYSEFFEHPEASKGTRIARSDQLWTATTPHPIVSDSILSLYIHRI